MIRANVKLTMVGRGEVKPPPKAPECTCKHPEKKYHTGSTHHLHCPVHQEWRRTHRADKGKP